MYVLQIYFTLESQFVGSVSMTHRFGARTRAASILLLAALLGRAMMRMPALILERRHELLEETLTFRLHGDRRERVLFLEATAHLFVNIMPK